MGEVVIEFMRQPRFDPFWPFKYHRLPACALVARYRLAACALSRGTGCPSVLWSRGTGWQPVLLRLTYFIEVPSLLNHDRSSERRPMKLKRAIVLGLLMIFSVAGMAMGGQNDNRRENRRERRENNQMQNGNRGDRHRGRWARRHRRRHRRRGMRM